MNKCDLDLTNKKFGDWVVLSESLKRNYWTFKCKCGCIKDVYYANLLNGKSKNCINCGMKCRQKNAENAKIGKKFGRLTITKRDPAKKNFFFCKCECGNIKSISYNQLLSGKTKSCGCFKKEVSKESGFKYKKNLEDTHLKYYKEDTCILSLQQKLSKNSTTKVKGVSKLKSGKYRAYINLKRKQIHLGTYKTIEEAQEARKEAEKEYFKPIIDKYKKG